MPGLHGSAAVATGVASAYLRQLVDKICPCCGSYRRNGIRLSGWNTDDREAFEELIGFLAAVPLFQKQLPKAELPRVANYLKRTVWQPGQNVVEQGKEGKAFFIIREGEASVMVKQSEEASAKESVRATLYYGDYFGGHTLTQNRPNVATIQAKGPMPLVTLSMSREEFERLGLHKELKFPKRPAIYDGRVIEDGQRMDDLGDGGASPGPRLKGGDSGDVDATEEEQAFIWKVVKENPNFRARGEIADDTARKLARAARRRRVEKGRDILVGGDLAHEFFVIKKGSFNLIPRLFSGADHQSVEARLASSAVTERLGRKQQFLLGMAVRGSSCSKLQLQRKDGADADADAPKAAPAVGGRMSRSQSVKMPNSSSSAKSAAMRRHSGFVTKVEFKRFKVGDTVARLVVGKGLTKEVGRVTEVISGGIDGEAVVAFPEPQGRQRIPTRYLRPAEDTQIVATLHVGDCCGEVELLYNTRQMATTRALEDSEVFAIDVKAFKECFKREPPHFKDHCRLLNEVHMLTPLLLAERAELARNAHTLTFGPGELVVRAGESHAVALWYVVEKGSCTKFKEAAGGEGEGGGEAPEALKSLHRAQHFGEEQITGSARGLGSAPDFSVAAGPEGVTFLVFDGEILRNLALDGGQSSGGSLFEFSKRGSSQLNALSAVPLEKLQMVAVLGEGGFGSVFLMKYEGKEHALKRMSKGYVLEAKVAKQICAERDIFSMVDSDFLVRFHRSYQDDQYIFMLMEYASGGHLWGMMCENWNVLRKDRPRGSATMFYVACVALAFDHLHERHIVYRDLKPENILLDHRGYAKLCDLGFARFVLSKSNTLVGTPVYMAPEMIDTPHAHDTAVDWWALGVLTFELITGQVPWDDQAASDTMGQILAIRRGQEHGPPDHLLPSGSILIKDFIKKLLCVNEEQRMGRRRGVAEVREHPWFTYQKFSFDALMAGQMRSPWQPTHKVIEKELPEDGSPLELDDSLFVNYTGDGTGWEAF